MIGHTIAVIIIIFGVSLATVSICDTDVSILLQAFVKMLRGI
jgi:hypothetical protein